MAKQLVNPIERHAEKGVLGICGLVLIVAIARYLVVSPNKTELGSETVTPATIDQKVVQKAAAVRTQSANAPVQVEIPEPLYSAFVDALDPFDSPGGEPLALTLPATVPLGPEVPIIDLPDNAPGESRLVEVVPVKSPVSVSGRTTFLTRNSDGSRRRVAANWVTVSVLFDVEAQMKLQGKEYGASRKEVVFGPLQLQRRARRAGGGWSDDDWEFIDAHPKGVPPPAPKLEFVQEDDQTVPTRETRTEVEKFHELLNAPSTQLALIRPLMTERIRGDLWRLPVITTERDILLQDDYYLRQNEPPEGEPSNRYLGEEALVPIGAEAPTPEQLLAEAEALRQQAWENKSADQAIKAYNRAREVADNTAISQSLRDKGTEKADAAEQTENDIRRWLQFNAAKTRSAAPGEKEDFKRDPLPVQQLWVHDAAEGSVVGGRTYQYRVRPLIYNRLAGQPSKFKDPADAAVLFLPGAWTEPVEVTIEPDTYFFLASKDARKDRIGVEFVKWEEGIWVKSRLAKFGVGDRLKSDSRHDVPSWEDETVPVNARVDFGVDMEVVDIDFARPFRERKENRRGGGVQFNDPAPACGVVLVDGAGRLHERFLPAEKRNPTRREVVGRTKKDYFPKPTE
ncbi:MAG: hypothetical protein ACE5EX_01420 [Phycisphaerae bacterium]